MIFYDKLPDMECLSGDTLPDFTISVDTDNDLSGCRMQLILARSNAPETCVVCKECDPVKGGFTVRLESSDTVKLGEDTYDMHFRLIAPDGKSYRKLAGSLYVHTAAQAMPST
jgi:hypothetical protein rflaF_05894